MNNRLVQFSVNRISNVSTCTNTFKKYETMLGFIGNILQIKDELLQSTDVPTNFINIIEET